MPYNVWHTFANPKWEQIIDLHSNQLFTKVSGSSLDAISETAIHTSVEQLTVQTICFSELDAIWLQNKTEMQNGCSLCSAHFKRRQNLVIWSPGQAVYIHNWSQVETGGLKRRLFLFRKWWFFSQIYPDSCLFLDIFCFFFRIDSDYFRVPNISKFLTITPSPTDN